MSVVVNANSDVAVWKRAILPEDGNLSVEEAGAILRLKMAKQDLDRADELAVRASMGALSQEEERELDVYLSVGGALEFFKSKARRSLQKPTSVPL